MDKALRGGATCQYCAWCERVLRACLETCLYRSLKHPLARCFILKYALASAGDELAFLLSVWFRDKRHPNLSPSSEHFKAWNQTYYKMKTTKDLSRRRIFLFSLTEKKKKCFGKKPSSFSGSKTAFLAMEEKVVSWFDFFCQPEELVHVHVLQQNHLGGPRCS